MSRILLLLFAGLKFGKLFGTVATMLISVGVYALIFGWRYAIGFIALLFIHEMGHFLAARQRGLPVGWPTFIPFMGAWIEMKAMPHDAETEAYVGLGGPLLGTVGALGCYFLARNYGIDWLLAVSYAGFFLNLFNLIPIPPLDGGRITAVLSPRIWLLGIPVFGYLLFTQFSPILVVIAILAAPHVWSAVTYRKDSPLAQTYYIVLLAFLAMMTHDVSQQLRGISRDDVEQTDGGAGSV